MWLFVSRAVSVGARLAMSQLNFGSCIENSEEGRRVLAALCHSALNSQSLEPAWQPARVSGTPRQTFLTVFQPVLATRTRLSISSLLPSQRSWTMRSVPREREDPYVQNSERHRHALSL